MKKITNFVLSSSLIFVIFSCEVDRTESIFEESPSQRIDKSISELRTLLLTQEQGFSGVYFPNNSIVGGVNFHMKFTPDLRVKITSDFKSDTSLTDTRYDIVTGTTAAELVFTSGSRHITDLVQEGGSGFNTFYGNNSFQYVGEENGVITFKEVRSDGIFVLSPSGFTNFDTESVASADATYANKQAFTEVDCATSSVFRTLVMELDVNGENTTYLLNYNAQNLFVQAENTNSEGISTTKDFGIAFTLFDGSPGIKISPAFEIDGVSFEDFTLNTNASQIEYTSTVNGATATIFYDDDFPIMLTDDLTELNAPNRLAIFANEFRFGVNPLTSCGWDEMIEQVDANLRTQGFTYTGVQLRTNYNSTSNTDANSRIVVLVQRLSDGLNTSGSYYINVENADNKVFVISTGFASGNGNFFAPSTGPLLDFFFSSKGLVYTSEGSFSSNLASFSNQSGTFTSLDNPALRTYGLFYQ